LTWALAGAVAALERIEVPVLAGIWGACIGAGVQMALCADIRLASTGARFGIPAVQIGMPYPLAAVTRLVDLIGAGAAAHVFLTAENFDAATALRRGLVDELVEADLATRLDALARAMAGHLPPAARAYKRMIKTLASRPASPAAAEIHRTFVAEAHFRPKLEEIAAKRRAKG